MVDFSHLKQNTELQARLQQPTICFIHTFWYFLISIKSEPEIEGGHQRVVITTWPEPVSRNFISEP